MSYLASVLFNMHVSPHCKWLSYLWLIKCIARRLTVTCKHLITPPSIRRERIQLRRGKILNHDREAAWTSKVRIQNDYPRSMSMNHLTRIPAPKDTRSPIRDELHVQISRYIGVSICIPVCLLRGANRTNCNYWASYKYDNNRWLMSPPVDKAIRSI